MSDAFMNMSNHNVNAPTVRIVGRADHPDFHEAVETLRGSAQIWTATDVSPELMIVAQSRPGMTCGRDIELLQRRAPLAGVVALLGSWCEGETRTGRPWPGIPRLYWYEFSAWWRRQLALRAAGLCPDWARRGDSASRVVLDPDRSATIRNGVIVLSAARRDTAAALTDVLERVGYATIWQPPGRRGPLVRGAAAGVWEGGQLDERESNDLAAFCRTLARAAAPVVALLDFPRRDRVEHAIAIGAATVLGKPWLNAELVATIRKRGQNYFRQPKTVLTPLFPQSAA